MTHRTNKVVHWGVHGNNTDHGPYVGIVNRYAEHYGLGVDHIDRNNSLFSCAPRLRDAAFVWIWNGMQNQGPLVSSLCRRRGIPHAFFEWGLLPQSQTLSVDLRGFCGASFLNDPLGWVTELDMARLDAHRAELQAEHPLRDEGYVLVVMQVECDTQMLYHTPYNDMDELIAHARAIAGPGDVRVRMHPKSGRNLAKKPLPAGVRQTHPAEPFLHDAAGARLVIGATSTCLWEAAVLGVPVLALGDHPLRTHCLEPDRAAAAALAMRVDRKAGDLWPCLERFNVRPLDTSRSEYLPCSTLQSSPAEACSPSRAAFG